MALCLVRPVTRATIWARDPAKTNAMVSEMAVDLGIAVTAAPDLATAVSAADIVVTTTPSERPLIMADWLRPGQHITAMGSDQHNKGELEPTCLTRAGLYVPDRQSQTAIMGELRGAIAAGLIAADRKFAELGAIVAGLAPGRTSPDQITIADLTGTGVQDTAIATFARQRATAAGIGTDFNS
jgi:ornithine cyclodeaminase